MSRTRWSTARLPDAEDEESGIHASRCGALRQWSLWPTRLGDDVKAETRLGDDVQEAIQLPRRAIRRTILDAEMFDVPESIRAREKHRHACVSETDPQHVERVA
jgi:hypothetical protein